MGSGGGGSQLVGYAYFLDLAYAFCEKVDHFYGFYLQENKVWSGNLTADGSTFLAKTGIGSEVYGSGTGESQMTFHNGKQISTDAYLSGRTGISLNYKNVCYLVFPQVYIGDNVRNVPTYGALLGRTNIDSCSHLLNFNTLKDIVGTTTVISNGSPALPVTVTSPGGITEVLTGTMTPTTYSITNANPAYIIYDILVGLLKLSKYKIDEASFTTAASVLFAEKLGLSLVVNSSKKGLDWIQDILTYIQGIVLYNSAIGKYSLKLFREDYDIDLLITVDTDVAKDIQFTRASRGDLPNTFTFGYQNISGTGIPKKDTISITNQANYETAGFVKNKDIDVSAVNTDEALALVTTSYFKRLSYPLASLSFKISPVDFLDFSVGSVFLFSDEVLTQNTGIVFRVLKVTGDSSRDMEFGIEAVEDIYSVGEIINVPSSIPITVQPDYTLVDAPNRVRVFPVSPENSTVKSVLVATTYPNNGAYVRNLTAYEVNTAYHPVPRWTAGIVTAITNNTEETFDRSLVITVENTDKNFYPISGTEQDVQRVVFAAFWGYEVISFKTCTQISDTIFEFSTIIRGGQDKVTTHNVGEQFWLSPMSGKNLKTTTIISNTPTIHVFAENNFGKSPELTTSFTYNYEVETPYSPNSLAVINGDGFATLQWTPRVRLKGANYRNCDTLFAGEDEGLTEGFFNIYKNNVLVYTYYPAQHEVYMEYTISEVGTYSVDTQLNTFKSPKKSVIVTSSNFIL